LGPTTIRATAATISISETPISGESMGAPWGVKRREPGLPGQEQVVS